MQSLDDKVAVVTGAASGIGRALAVSLARRHALLALCDIDEVGLASTVELARRSGAREVRADALDVGDRAAFAAYADAVAAHFGRVDLVVNNAGVALTGPLVDVSYEDLDWIVGVNFWGVVHGTKEFLPHLIASGDGHLVNVSSVFGLMSTPGQGAYNATKFAVRGLTEALREEMLAANEPVGVTSVHPGGVKTAIARNSRVSPGVDKQETVRLFDTRLARTTPERTAERIVRAVLHNRPRVVVGPDAHFVQLLVMLSGARYQEVVSLVSRRALTRARVVHHR
jgi:NAD(P)-dependent dehydrogenase (short-subunit alcohol dehydrogenase family)